MIDEGELRASWSISSLSSSEDESYIIDNDDNDTTTARFGGRNNSRNNNNYTATRVFYRNRQLQSTTTTANDVESGLTDGLAETLGPTGGDVMTNGGEQTAAENCRNYNVNNDNAAADEHYFNNFNYKSARYKRDSAARDVGGGGDSKNAGSEEDSNYRPPRVNNYYKRYVGNCQQDRRRNMNAAARERTKQYQRGDNVSSDIDDNDSDRSKERNPGETVRKTLGGRENVSEVASQLAQKPQRAWIDNSTGGMRYSKSRRSPRKWQLLPLPTAPTHKPKPFVRAKSSGPRRGGGQASLNPPNDDRRPYRRNLPPRMLARLKPNNNSRSNSAHRPTASAGTSSERSVTQDVAAPVYGINNSSCHNDNNDHSANISHRAASPQNSAAEKVLDGPSPSTSAAAAATTVSTNVWKERAEFYQSALPKSEDEEQYMLQRALEESQRQQLQQQQQLLQQLQRRQQQQDMMMMMREPWMTDISQLSLAAEFEATEEPSSSVDEVHLLLQDQATGDTAAAGPQTLHEASSSTSQNNGVKNNGMESRLLGQLDYGTRMFPGAVSDHPDTDAFGLRDMHPATTMSGTGLDPNLVAGDQGSSKADGGSLKSPPGFHGTDRYDSSLPIPFDTTATTTLSADVTSSYNYPVMNNPVPLLAPSSTQEESNGQPSGALLMSSVSATVTENNRLYSVSSATHSSNTMVPPYEQHTVRDWTADIENPTSLPYAADGREESHGYNSKDSVVFEARPKNHLFPNSSKETLHFQKDSLFGTNRLQLFPNVIPPVMSATFDSNIPETRSYYTAGTSAGIIGDSKPIGFVPGVKGTSSAKTEEVETVTADGGQDAAAIAAVGSKPTTMARVQPSSTFQTNQLAGNAAAIVGTDSTTDMETNTRSIADQTEHIRSSAETECKTTASEGPPQPPLPALPEMMPPAGYLPVPWGPMPAVPPQLSYPGAPYPPPYGAYPPPWAYCAAPVPMMPLMPHPVMSMVPMPYWMAPPPAPMPPLAVHPAMRMRHSPLMPAPATSAAALGPEMSSDNT